MEALMRKGLIATVSIVLAAYGLIIWHDHVSILPLAAIKIMVYLAKAGLAMVTLTLIPLLLTIIPVFFPTRSLTFQRFLRNAEEYEAHVEALEQFEKRDLELARTYLDYETGRTRHVIGLIAGSPDKLALVGIATLIPASVVGLFHQATVVGRGGNPDPGDQLLRAVVFAIGSMFVLIMLRGGGMLMQLRRYAYQVELVNAALKRMDPP